ncbi:NAD(P)-binding domain-containing protein [Aureimonas sp. ME7]|uniref:NAD(P)-binding domain-containing protein n=1 Tax=Aureimonas sp. ME7 TaxID=2744252 RepID=UPI0015F58CCA|nr:NAD(P)-binding domain-containing protein [Aureimonas sp. ME7]
MTAANTVRVGFVGLGTMGREMARNLVEAGFPVAAYDIDPAAVEALARIGTRPAADAAAAGADADVGVTMLSDTPHVEAVALGAGGLAGSMAAPLNCDRTRPGTPRRDHVGANTQALVARHPKSAAVTGALLGDVA